MPRGGKREGAGRKKGDHNKRTEENIAKAKEYALMPLDFMLGLLNNPNATHEDRKWAAKEAGPYVHSKLQTVDQTMKATIDGRIEFVEVYDK